MANYLLTKKQDAVFLFIREYMEKNTHSPYIREIQEGCGIISYKGARVKNMNKGEVLRLYNILGALEGLAARGAPPNLSKKHYERLEKYAGLLETYFQENEPAKYEKTNLVFHSIITTFFVNFYWKKYSFIF